MVWQSGEIFCDKLVQVHMGSRVIDGHEILRMSVEGERRRERNMKKNTMYILRNVQPKFGALTKTDFKKKHVINTE